MSEETETIATLLARKEYARAVPLLKRDLQKYPTNVRIRLQLADALAGAGEIEEALQKYDETAKYYDDSELVVQAIAVRKKAEKIRAQSNASGPAPVIPEKQPTFTTPTVKSPLFENMTTEERDALVKQMQLEQYDQGDLIITEGEQGSSLYVLVSGEVKVYTKGPKGESVYLAKLSEGDFFGEVSVLTGKPRTATISASTRAELLRLDKEKFDMAAAQHPRLRTILDDFYRRRVNQTVEAMIETLRHK